MTVYYFLLVVSIVLAVCKSSLYNSYAKNNATTLRATFHFNTVSYGVAAIVALVGTLIGQRSFSVATVLCAFFYAAIVFGLQTISIIAMSVGAMSTTAICVMYGMIIPSVAGPIFWAEPIGFLQIVGIVMMIVSLWFLKGKTPPESRKKTNKWILLALVAFVLSGMAGVMEKIHQSTSGREERTSFVFVACVFMFAFSVLGGLITYIKREKKQAAVFPILAIPSGLVIGFYSMVNLTLSGKLDSMIYYPIANGGAMILTVVASVMIFKEKFDRSRIIGTVVGILGILFLSLPL